MTQGEKKFSSWELLSKWETILFIIFLLVIIINSNLSEYFLDPVNILNTTFNFDITSHIAYFGGIARQTCT